MKQLSLIYCITLLFSIKWLKSANYYYCIKIEFGFVSGKLKHAKVMFRLNQHGLWVNGQQAIIRISTRENKTLVDSQAFHLPDKEWGLTFFLSPLLFFLVQLKINKNHVYQ
jgi:hypothetical protein